MAPAAHRLPSRTPGPLLLLPLALALLCPAGAARAQMRMPDPNACSQRKECLIDARRGIPLTPAFSWKDGIFVENAAIPDLGLHPRISGMYQQEPLGANIESHLHDRFILYASAVLSINSYLDFGLSLPMLLWQDDQGYNFSRTALGDLRAHVKFRLPIFDTKDGPGPFNIALAMGLGFPTGDTTQHFTADTYSYFPRVIADLRTLKRYVLVTGNLGGIFAGTGRLCPALPMAGGPPPDPGCTAGFGNHLFWGLGVSATISTDVGLFITGELMGSFSFTNENAQARAPVFAAIGLRRMAANKLTFGVAYGSGLNEGSPNHTVLVSVGYAIEHEEEKKKSPPTIKVIHEWAEQPIAPNALPPGATAPATTPVQGQPAGPLPPEVAPPSKTPDPAGAAGQPPATQQGVTVPPAAPNATTPSGKRSQETVREAYNVDFEAQDKADKKAKEQGQPRPKYRPKGQPSKKVETIVEVPDDWWPAEKKDDKKGGK